MQATKNRSAALPGVAGEEKLPRLEILVAEDNMVNQGFALMILQREGHSVTGVANGAAVLEALRQVGYDLVLMDVDMPGVDGVEATRRIRNGSEADVLDRDVPIIAMTAHSEKGDRQRFLDAGMDDYIAKPLDWGELTSIMRRTLAAKGRLP